MQEILIIDDDLDFNESLTKMLSRKGYGVRQATTGQGGVDLFKKHPVDLVIADILLPDRDGVNVILDIQKALPGIKIIAISGGGHCASGEEYLNDIQLLCNVQHTLAKPFQCNQLFDLIDGLFH